MPRGGGRSGGGASRSSSPNRSTGSMSQAPRRPTPTPTTSTPTTSGGMFGGIGSMFVSGMAIGAGSEIGHQAMRGLMGGSHGGQQQQTEQSEPTSEVSQPKYYCQSENDSFVSCLKSNADSISFCQTYLDVLKECEKKMKY